MTTNTMEWTERDVQCAARVLETATPAGTALPILESALARLVTTP
jgi:hypothetical protein